MTTTAEIAPATLNGYPVIESKRSGDGFIILALRMGHKPHPYVVAYWHPTLGDGWHHGDCCADVQEAAEAFKLRLR